MPGAFLPFSPSSESLFQTRRAANPPSHRDRTADLAALFASMTNTIGSYWDIDAIMTEESVCASPQILSLSLSVAACTRVSFCGRPVAGLLVLRLLLARGMQRARGTCT